jgi:hypothetical protein
MHPLQTHDTRECRDAEHYSYLQELAQGGHHTARDEAVDVQAAAADAAGVCTPTPIDPLHDEHPLAAQIAPDPRNLHRGIVLEVLEEVLRAQRRLKGNELELLESCAYFSRITTP